MSSIADIIVNELRKITDRRESGRNIVICCPYHAETTPSFNINIDPTHRKVPLGWGYCFACGASKEWNEIAERLGLKTITKNGVAESSATVRKQDPRTKDKLLPSKVSLTMHDLVKHFRCGVPMPIEENEKWRGFSGKLLGKIGAYIAVDDFDNKVLILPVMVDGILEGGIKALWEKPKSKKVLRYKNMEGEWAKTHGLFLYDSIKERVKKKGYVILVEGARDALRLYKYGQPAVAILGTKNWSVEKRNLIIELAPDKVIVMMDGDKAGIEASNMLMKDLKGKVSRQLVKMKDYNKRAAKITKQKDFECDPGNIPSELLKEIIDTF